MESTALENKIKISVDSQLSSTSKSIAIFLTTDWICLFIIKLQITATVWLQLEILSNSFSLSSGISLAAKSKFLILESKRGIQQRWWYRTKWTNTWLSCFRRKTLCRKILLWYLTKYKVGLSSNSTSFNRSLDYSPQTRSELTCKWNSVGQG